MPQRNARALKERKTERDENTGVVLGRVIAVEACERAKCECAQAADFPLLSFTYSDTAHLHVLGAVSRLSELVGCDFARIARANMRLIISPQAAGEVAGYVSLKPGACGFKKGIKAWQRRFAPGE